MTPEEVLRDARDVIARDKLDPDHHSLAELLPAMRLNGKHDAAHDLLMWSYRQSYTTTSMLVRPTLEMYERAHAAGG